MDTGQDAFFATSGFVEQTLTAGVKSATLDYRVSAGTGTASIRRARLELWRVS